VPEVVPGSVSQPALLVAVHAQLDGVTVKLRDKPLPPAGPGDALDGVKLTMQEKPATTLTGPFITTETGDVVAVAPSLNPVNVYPAFGVALTIADEPASYSPVPLTVPSPDGFAVTVSWYCCVSRRITLLPVSATRSWPDAASAIPLGPLNCAVSADPPSPL
jgi:hypothetical protein